MPHVIPAAKKKVLDFYNQLKANTQKNMGSYQQDSAGNSSMPTTNAQYRGLPSDDGDDLLTGDISALHLSDYDVYAQTGQRKSIFQLNCNMLSGFSPSFDMSPNP